MSGPNAQRFDIVDVAMAFATVAHADQKYGDEPYTAHLEDVAGVLFDHHAIDPEMLAAAWLHDTVEDTGTSIEKVREKFGEDIAELVAAVTSEPGRNRKERNAATYPKIVKLLRARVLKLADRIANVSHAWGKQDPILFMYQREHRDFRAALRPKEPCGVELEMWNRLDKILGWWEPTPNLVRAERE
jgi:(p)ppGpp synthase/HD superfamily hydrolase